MVPAVTWAAAVAAMIAVGVFVVRTAASRGGSSESAPRGTGRARHRRDGLDAAIEEGFLPATGAAATGDREDVSVLHVELPRSAMMQVGIEVSPDRADETVRAECMVGADGLARAVRFVDVGGSD